MREFIEILESLRDRMKEESPNFESLSEKCADLHHSLMEDSEELKNVNLRREDLHCIIRKLGEIATKSFSLRDKLDAEIIEKKKNYDSVLKHIDELTARIEMNASELEKLRGLDAYSIMEDIKFLDDKIEDEEGIELMTKEEKYGVQS